MTWNGQVSKPDIPFLRCGSREGGQWRSAASWMQAQHPALRPKPKKTLMIEVVRSSKLLSHTKFPSGLQGFILAPYAMLSSESSQPPLYGVKTTSKISLLTKAPSPSTNSLILTHCTFPVIVALVAFLWTNHGT